jgi:predicted phosphohydrolase
MDSIQLVSDIHLELNKEKRIKIVPTSDYLALLGDIGDPYQERYRKFLSKVSKKFKKVFVISGNHEFYHNEFYATHKQIRDVCSPMPNVIYLENMTYQLPNFRVFGTTLWSDVSDFAGRALQDTTLIRYRDRYLTVEDIRRLHKKAVDRIHSALENSTKPLVLLTHHGMSHGMNGKYKDSPVMSGFTTNLEHLFRKPLVAAMSGHTHVCTKMEIDGIPYASNCAGYDDEETGYDPSMIMKFQILKKDINKNKSCLLSQTSRSSPQP